MNGQEQIISSLADHWRARLDVVIRDRESILAIRSLDARLDGRAGEVLIPTFDGARAPWPILHGVAQSPCITRRRQLDGTVYEDPEIPAASAIIATVSDEAAVRSTSLQMLLTQGTRPESGQYFGIGERLYVIRTTHDVSGGTIRLTFRPRLRATALIGTVLIFTRPVCLMRPASDDQGLQSLELRRFANLTLEFVEAF